jgi:glutathione S-transferase
MYKSAFYARRIGFVSKLSTFNQIANFQSRSFFNMQAIELYGTGQTPNPIKVAIFLEELGIPFKPIPVDIQKGAHKQEPFVALNPNGRLPAIHDPNTGVTLFESGAIIEYLVDTYDKEKKLQYETPQEKYITKSWLHFQMSGQGPYFGQVYYFKALHWEVCVS